MTHIPPHERYSQHAAALKVSKDDLDEAVKKYGLDPTAIHSKKLSGGFQNANFLVEDARGKKHVFRFYSEAGNVAQREADILRFLQTKKVNTPEVRDLFEIKGRRVAVLSFIEGELFQNHLGNHSVGLALFQSVGAEIAKIHSIEFSHPGFIGPGVLIGSEYENCAQFMRQFIERVIGSLRDERLPSDLRARTLRLIEKEWHLVLETEPTRQLVHCDFNPKNILVSAQQKTVTGLLDWEFCLSGNGYLDLGNFFRFATDYPDGAEESFAQGYLSIRGELHPRWRDIGKLLDLANMCSFLERPENYPETFRTARWVIEETLTGFGY